MFYTLPCIGCIIKATWKCKVPFTTQPADSEATNPSLSGPYIPLTWFYVNLKLSLAPSLLPKDGQFGKYVVPPAQLHWLPWKYQVLGPAGLTFSSEHPQHCKVRLSRHHVHTLKSPKEARWRRGDPVILHRQYFPLWTETFCKQGLAGCG